MCRRDGPDWPAFEAQAILPLLDAERWDDALATCLEAYQEALYHYVFRRLESCGAREPAAQAQDIVADTFLTAWRRFATFGRRSTVRVWLFGIAIHFLRNVQAQRENRGKLEHQHFETIMENVGGTWLVEELPRTPAVAAKWRAEIAQQRTAQAWDELLASVQPALQQVRRRSTFSHFLLEQHLFEGRSLREISRTTGMSNRQVHKEWEKARALFQRCFIALVSDPREGE